MGAYAMRRVLLIVPTLLVTTLVIFLLIRMVPGTVVDVLIAQQAESGIGGEQLEAARATITRELGLDAPIPVQYGRWLGVLPRADGRLAGIIQGDFGMSFRTGGPVAERIRPRLPATVELSILSLIITYLIAVPIGVYSAVRQDTAGDYISRSFAILWLSVPGFWIATMVIVLPSIWWGWSPSIHIIPFFENPLGHLGMFILPAAIMGLTFAGGTMRDTRTWMLEVLNQDYIRTAWAKGLNEETVLIRHAFRNTLIPVVTRIGYQLPTLVGGAVIMENIFGVPGLGQLLLATLTERDYPVVTALLLIGALAIVLANLLADLAYGVVDPRIRYQ